MTVNLVHQNALQNQEKCFIFMSSGDEALAQAAQGSCGCSIHGGVLGPVELGHGQPARGREVQSGWALMFLSI